MGHLLLALDPGDATGWSVWDLEPDEPIFRLDYGVIPNGIDGFIAWTMNHHHYLREAIVVCERFVPDGGAQEYEPLGIEGALRCALAYLGAPPPTFQLRSRKRNLGDAKVRDQLLKTLNLWVTGADPKVAWVDGRDVNDTAIHALVWAKDHEHQPTLAAFWPEA